MYTENGINENTYKLLFEDIDNYNLKKEEQYSDYYAKIISTLSLYTLYKEKSIFKNLLLSIFGYPLNTEYITYDQEKKEWIYNDGNEIITFDMLSNHIDDKNIKKKLLSHKKRDGHCHDGSIDIAKILKNSRIITGTIQQYNRKILHSVVEISDKNQEKNILDYTLNLKIPKESYIKLTNFQELNIVESNELENDFKILLDFFDSFGHKEYLLFRDELIKDIEKNKSYLVEDEERY